MLTFTLWLDDDRATRLVHIDPLAVASVEETDQRRAFGGSCPVAVVTLTTGDKYTVYDGARTSATMIGQAKANPLGLKQPEPAG